jgi:hypothetical protein
MPAAIAIPAIATVGAAGATAAASIYGNRRQSRAAEAAARYSRDSANYAADLEAKAAQEALAHAKEVEAARQREFREVQDRNFGIYQQERALEQGRYDDLQARMAPYRRLGAGSVGQLMRLPHALPGSLGSRMGG